MSSESFWPESSDAILSNLNFTFSLFSHHLMIHPQAAHPAEKAALATMAIVYLGSSALGNR